MVARSQNGNPGLLIMRSALLLLIAALPGFCQIAVRNAADGSTSVAPGSFVAIYGSNLAPNTKVADRIPLPTSIDGVTVEVVDGARTIPAPLWFVSPSQINAQLPFGLSARVEVRVRGASQSVAISPRAPRFFTVTMDGIGEPLLFHANYTLVSAQSPAAPGEAVIAYVNGLGAVTPDLAVGAAGGDGLGSPLNRVSEAVSVTVGGRPATVDWAGMAPGFIVYQVNFRIPDDVPAGMHPIVVGAGGSFSRATVAASISLRTPIVAAGTVGPGGGVVSGGGIRLEVPAGAFAAGASLTVGKPPGAIPNEAHRASDVFVLTGLPETIGAPIEVAIDLQSPGPAGETYVMAEGLDILEARVDGSRVYATIPATEELTAQASKMYATAAAPAGASRSGPEISLYVMTFYRRSSSAKGNFLLFYPPELEQTAAASAVVLEEAYQKVADTGLSWAARRRVIRAVLQPFGASRADRWGEVEPSILGVAYHSISLNSTKISGAALEAEARASIAHELYHIAQALYDPRGAYRQAKFSGTWLWFQEASATWFEGVFLGDDAYVPQTVKSHNYSFLTTHGLEFPPGNENDVRDHGYGASLFLRSLAASNPGAVTAILKRGAVRGSGLLANPSLSPVEAIDAEVGVSGKWRTFVKDYIAGRVTAGGYPTKGELLGQVSVHCNLATGPCAPTVWNSADLSAKVWMIDLPDNLKPNAKLVLELKDPAASTEAVLFRGTDWGQVAAFTAKQEIADADALARQSRRLILVVIDFHASKPFTESREITLTIEAGELFPKYAVISLANAPWIMTRSTIYYEAPNRTRDVPQHYDPMGNVIGGPTLSGQAPLTWTGNSFSASGKITSGENWCQIAISGSITEANPTRTLSARFSQTCFYKGGDETSDTEKDVSFSNIPFLGFNRDGYGAVFQKNGAGTRSLMAPAKWSFVTKRAGVKYQDWIYSGPGTEDASDKIVIGFKD